MSSVGVLLPTKLLPILKLFLTVWEGRYPECGFITFLLLQKTTPTPVFFLKSRWFCFPYACNDDIKMGCLSLKMLYLGADHSYPLEISIFVLTQLTGLSLDDLHIFVPVLKMFLLRSK